MEGKGVKPNQITYQAVLRSHSFAGNVVGAKAWFERMLAAGVTMEMASYNGILQACARAGDADAAEEWLGRMAADGIVPDRTSYVSTIASSAVAGDMPRATKWLVELGKTPTPGMQPDITLHNEVLKGFVRGGNVKRASEWFTQMARSGTAPNVDSYNLVMQACAEARDRDAAVEWFEAMIQGGLTPNEESYVELIRTFSKAGDTAGATRWFNRMLVVGTPPTVDTYRAIMFSCTRNGDASAAVEWLERMETAGFLPDRRSYTMVIRSWAQQGDTRRALQWFDRMRGSGVMVDVTAFNALLTAFHYAKDAVGLAKQFNRIAQSGVAPDEISYGLAMRACAEAGDSQGALDWLKRFELEQLDKKQVPYGKIIQSFSRAGDPVAAGDWTDRAIDVGLSHNVINYNAVIRAYLDSKQSKKARYWLEKRMGPDTVLPESSTYMMFIRNSAANKATDAAAEWHRKMTEVAGIPASADTMRVVLAAYAERGDKANVFLWLERMVAAGFLPDQAIYTSVVKTFAKKGDVAGAREWIERMSSSGVEPDLKAYTAFITSCLRRPNGIADAANWLDWMTLEGMQLDSIVYNLVLDGHAKRGDLDAASKLFDRMIATGVTPTDATYVALLESCASRKQPQVAEAWLQKMRSAGIAPTKRACAAMALSYASGVAGSGDAGADALSAAAASTDEWLGSMQKAEGKLPSKQNLRATLLAALSVFSAAERPRLLQRWKEFAAKNGVKVEAEAWKKKPTQAKPVNGTSAAGRMRFSTPDAVAKVLVEQLRSGWKDGVPRTAELIDQLQSVGGQISLMTFESILTALAKWPDKAADMHGRMGELGLLPTRYTYTIVLDCYARAGDTEGTVKWFEQMVAAGSEPNEKHFDYVVGTSLRASNDAALIERVVATAGEDEHKRHQRYELVVRKCAAYGNMDLAVEWAERALAENGFTVRRQTCLLAARVCLHGRDEARLWWWLRLTFGQHFGTSNYTRGWSAALESFVGYCTHADEKNIILTLAEMNVVADWVSRLSLSPQWSKHMGHSVTDSPELPYATIVTAYSRLGHLAEATTWFDKAMAAGVAPNLKMINAMLTVNSKNNDVETTRRWFQRIISAGLTPDTDSYTAVLDALCAGTHSANAADEWYAEMVATGHTSSSALQIFLRFHIAMGEIQSALRVVRETTASLPEMVRKVNRRVFVEMFHAASNAVEPDPTVVEASARTMLERGCTLKTSEVRALQSILGRKRSTALCEEFGVDVEALAGKSM